MELLRVDRVVKRFGGLIAVNDVSLSLEKGERLGLIGPNGAGKTTLFNLISGYYKPDKGKIIFKGKDITGRKPYEISRLGIGRTFQIVKPLPNLTTLENVAVGSLLKHPDVDEAMRRASEILRTVGLHDKRNMKAASLNLPEKKRLELARALAIEPDLLLLDEVVAGLNPSEVDELLKLLKEINESGIAILMVEHVMRAVMNISERIIVMDYGVKIAEGTPDEIASNPRVIEAYLGREEL